MFTFSASLIFHRPRRLMISFVYCVQIFRCDWLKILLGLRVVAVLRRMENSLIFIIIVLSCGKIASDLMVRVSRESEWLYNTEIICKFSQTTFILYSRWIGRLMLIFFSRARTHNFHKSRALSILICIEFISSSNKRMEIHIIFEIVTKWFGMEWYVYMCNNFPLIVCCSFIQAIAAQFINTCSNGIYWKYGYRFSFAHYMQHAHAFTRSEENKNFNTIVSTSDHILCVFPFLIAPLYVDIEQKFIL